MTAAFLQSELASLIQDSKRRQSDVRTAAEKSLADLKTIQVTSETQLAGDLLRRPHFIEPFVLACNSKYVKLAVTGAVCLQRLIASRAIPPSRLADILNAFQEATQQGLDVQLKILQALPSLLQLYAEKLQGDALAKILSLCISLAGNKTALVSSTASATFQQLITTLFEKRTSEDDDRDEESGDIASVFNDMCMVVAGEQPQFLRPQGLTLPIALEVIELSLSNSRFSVLDIASCLAACDTHLIPGITQILEKTSNFAAFGRSLRVLYLLTTGELDRVVESMLQPLSVVSTIMDRPSGPPWRRILCLEFMRSIVADAQLLRTIYEQFDCNENRKSLIGDLMAILVRVAAEDPALIGLGRQSTIPTNSESDNVHVGSAQVDVDAMGSVLQASSNVTGISSRWSTLSSPLLEQPERPTTTDIPETYIYTLVLGCVASLSDGLSKYVMPLSVPNRATLDATEVGEPDGSPARKNSQVRRAEKYQRLLNPLKRDDLKNRREVEVCAKLIENCWPAVLATCSTFLNSALDSHFYHILVRTVQKLAQVSGVLELYTPRDALLTTLAKVSVPINASSIVTALHGNKLAKSSREEDDDELDGSSIKSPVISTPRMSVDISRQPLNVRNLLCLRALLNLGIALGPTLSETSWFIIIQALQQADALMSVHPATRSASNKAQAQEDADLDGQSSLGSEITAVGTASKRMMESTKTYSDETLEIFFRSVFKMVETLVSNSTQQTVSKTPNDKHNLAISTSKHRATRSVSGVLPTSGVLHIEVEFVLKTINDLARINLYRFCSLDSKSCSWDLVVVKLLSVVADTGVNPQLRLQTTTILNTISMECIKVLEKQNKDSDEASELRSLCLRTLILQLSLLYKKTHVQPILVTDIDIHRRLLEALENIVSHSGDSLTTAWRTVFEILQNTTGQMHHNLGENADTLQKADKELVLARTIPPAFRTVQLIVSDFLSIIDPLSFSTLVQLLPSFGTQENDLNISLSTTVLFSDLSSLLLERTDMIDVPIMPATLASGTNGDQAVRERKATDVSSLWFAIILELCDLCKDDRSDVRNSALQVLLRTLESSSTQIASSTWNVTIQEALLPILKGYSGKEEEVAAWHLSYTQLLKGFVGLLSQNAESITNSAEFPSTWKAITTTFNDKLAEQSLDSQTIIFTSAADLLRALKPTEIQRKAHIIPFLQIWLNNHPASIRVGDKSNQDALCAHARLFKALTDNSGNATDDFSVDGQDLAELAIAASKQAILASVHPPYSSDIAKMAPEQTAIVDNLQIIKLMMSTRMQGFTSFLLDMIDNVLSRNTAIEVENQRLGTNARSLRRPTLIAFMSQCIIVYRSLLKEDKIQATMLNDSMPSSALQVLARIVATKYTNIPTNNDGPAWKTATSAIVELIQTIPKHVKDMPAEEVIALARPTVKAFESIIGAPTFEKQDPTTSSDTINTDETFDIENASQFHKACLPLLQHSDFPEEYRKQYSMTLFYASLVAKLWFGDLPLDLLNDPLSKFKEVRAGTIRPPDFLPRAKIPYEALNALIDLVNCEDKTEKAGSLAMARAAAPYVLLRIAHSIKVFLADQRLRNLIPPPKQIQHELKVILNEALELRVVDEAFKEVSSTTTVAEDGKTHLRLLYPLVLRLKEFWVRLPRLKVCAWQENEDGKGIEDALEKWGNVLAEGW